MPLLLCYEHPYDDDGPDGRYHQLSQAFESSPDFNNNPQKYLIGAGGRSDSWNMLNNWAPIPTTPTTLGNNAAYKDAMNFLYGDTQGTFKMTNQNGVMTWWTELGQEKQGMIGTYNMLKRKTGYQTSNYNFNPYKEEPSSVFDDVDWDRTIKGIGDFEFANSVKTTMIEHAQKLSPLTKTTSRYLKVFKGVGIGATVATNAYSTITTYNYYNNGGSDWRVGVKYGLDLTMTGIGFLGPIGFGISAGYYIIDSATGGFGGFGEIPQN